MMRPVEEDERDDQRGQGRTQRRKQPEGAPGGARRHTLPLLDAFEHSGAQGSRRVRHLQGLKQSRLLGVSVRGLQALETPAQMLLELHLLLRRELGAAGQHFPEAIVPAHGSAP
jgi:hypothetical protein